MSTEEDIPAEWRIQTGISELRDRIRKASERLADAQAAGEATRYSAVSMTKDEVVAWRMAQAEVARARCAVDDAVNAYAKIPYSEDSE